MKRAWGKLRSFVEDDIEEAIGTVFCIVVAFTVFLAVIASGHKKPESAVRINFTCSEAGPAYLESHPDICGKKD